MNARPVPIDTVGSTSNTTLLSEHVPAYRSYLVDRGHAASYVEHCEAVVAHVDLWMTQARRRLCDLDEKLIAEFLYQRVPRRRAAVPGRRPDDHHAPLVHLLVVLRTARALPPKAPDAAPVGEELRRFDHSLSHARGLARSTRKNTLRLVGRLLRERFAGDAFDFNVIAPEHVRSFLAEQAKVHTTPTSLNTVLSSLRGCFRQRSTQGDPTHSLVGALSTPANWQQASLPTSLKPAEVERLVAAIGQAGTSMRRADAMVRCALDLGLRIGEVARLSLDDINWAAGTITLRRIKGRREHVMPLPVATGDAIANTVRDNIIAGMNALKAAEPDLHPSSRTKTREVKADANVGFAASISSGPPAAVGRPATAGPMNPPPHS
jgi:integrase